SNVPASSPPSRLRCSHGPPPSNHSESRFTSLRPAIQMPPPPSSVPSSRSTAACHAHITGNCIQAEPKNHAQPPLHSEASHCSRQRGVMPIQHIVVIGAGLAGGRAVLELRRQGFGGHITLVGDE